MARGIKVLGIGLLIAATAMVATPAKAGSPTSNADNSHEYNAYVYGYISKINAQGLENSLYNDWQNASSNANSAYSQYFWAELAADYANAGFMLCYQSLNEDRNDLWGDAKEEFDDALTCIEYCIMVMEMGGASSYRIQQAENVEWYLGIASNAALNADWASRFFSFPVLVTR